MDALRSIWTWFVSGLLILFWLPLLAAIRLFDRDPVRYRTGRWFRRLGVVMTKVNPFWSITVEGAEAVENPRNPYVVVCNHQSLADIPIVSLLPWEMKWVGKKELFDMPITGWMMRLTGDIAVDRGNPRSGAHVLMAAREYLRQHCSVIFFPEGTRSRGGKVLRFTDGAFRLAIKAGVPVLPVVLDGTKDALPKHSWKFGRAEAIRLKVLPPVPTAGLTSADTVALRDQVRDQIIDQIAAWRGVPREAVDAYERPLSQDSIKTSAPES